MTTDINLSQIVFNRLSNEKYHELKTSGQLNDQQFYITPDLDTNPGLIQDYMSNCITKIPQHINLELSTDGTLTLKAGSVVYVPNGKNADDSNRFDEVNINSDIIFTQPSNQGVNFIYLNNLGTALSRHLYVASGTVIPAEFTGTFYNTETNQIYYCSAGIGTPNSSFSFPIAIVTVNEDNTAKVASIDQVFNGMGYMGAVAFAVPGVQVIIPNGFNSNGLLNNYIATVERVLIKDYAADNLLGVNLPLTLTNSPLLSAGDMIYVEEENRMYKGSIAELSKRTEVEIAKVTTDSTKITSLTPLPIYNRILASYQTSTSNNIIGNHIGQIGYTTRTDVPEGCAWCDGAEYTQAQFPDVYQMLVDGKLSSTDYSIFNNSVSTNGYCALFALDSSAQKFKVPKLLDKYVMDLADNVPVVGNGMALGLTNGTSLEGLGFSGDGIVIHRTDNYGVDVGTANSGSGSTKNAAGVTTDPTKSGMIADTSNLGKTVTLKAYVVLYSSAAGASEVQAAEFIQGLSGKANTDLSNVSSNIDYVVEQGETNGITWEKWKSGKLIQSGSMNVTITSRITNVPAITFPKPMSDTNYKVFTGTTYNSGISNVSYNITSGLQTSGLNSNGHSGNICAVDNTAMSSGTVKIWWRIEGQGA